MKLRVNLGALTRKQATFIIEVPDGMSPDQFDAIARTMYDHTEAEDFVTDTQFWERGECWCEQVDSQTPVTNSYPHPEDLDRLLSNKEKIQKMVRESGSVRRLDPSKVN
jgi:hypothetical protein